MNSNLKKKIYNLLSQYDHLKHVLSIRIIYAKKNKYIHYFAFYKQIPNLYNV